MSSYPSISRPFHTVMRSLLGSCLLLTAPSAMADITASFANLGPVDSGTFQILANPLGNDTITLSYSIDAAGAVSMDATTTSTDATVINLVNQFDRPNGTAGTTTNSGAFNTSFSLTISPTSIDNPTPRLSITTLGGGGLAVQGQNSNRVDGLNMATPHLETLDFSLSAPPGISLRFKDWSWVIGNGADMRLSAGANNQDFIDIADSGTLGLDLVSNALTLGDGSFMSFGQTPNSSNGAALRGLTFEVLGSAAEDAVVSFANSGSGFGPSPAFLIASAPDVTITLGFSISETGVISLDASSNHPSGTFADIVQEWDHPNVGSVTDPALFGKNFTLTGTASGKNLSITELGGGGLGIQGQNSNRVDGLNYGTDNTTSAPETLLWILNAPPDLAIDFKTWSYLDGAGGDMRVSNGVTHHDFPNMAAAAGTFALDELQLGHGDYLAFHEIPGIGATDGAAIAGFSFTVASREAPFPARGSLLCERWDNTHFYSTNELVADRRFYGPPDMSAIENPATSEFLYAGYYASTRTRGWITIPVTGHYRFWISARSGAQLLLSEDGSKYTKRVIAELNPEVGSGTGGVPSNSGNLWDVYVTQMSEEIHLTAGQTYYLETIQTNGHGPNPHASIAWARPGLARTPMDLAFVHPYTPTADDADDDYLPDAWEIQHGLDPTDNGFTDLARQGERGDFDGDGLTNREEYLLGTHPANPDTDGDGLSDFDEIYNYGTDPLVSDAPSGLIVGTLDLTSHSTTGSPWTLTSQGLIPPSFRGSISWNFSVPSDGFWLLDVATTLLGNLYLRESVDIEVLIDGISIGEKTLHYGGSPDALLRVFTPYLTTGNHTLGLKINNNLTRRMVGIQSIKVIEPQGADLNSDGIPDWVAAQIMADNALRPYSVTSRTSPANLEGSARMRSLTTLNGIPVTAGLDQSHWYADLPLNASTATSFSVLLEHGFEETGAISWDSTNVFSSETLTIRKGDSLKLVGHPLTGPTGQAVTLTFGPAGWNGTVGATGTYDVQLTTDNDHHIHTLLAPGTYKVRATLADASTALATVIVRQADFPQTPKDIFASVPGTLTFPTTDVHSILHFEGGDSIYIRNPAIVHYGTETLLRVFPSKTGAFNMIARLHDGGPILGSQALHGIGLSDVLQNNSSFAYTSADYPGYKIIRSPIVATDLPEGATLVITIFRAGVSFLDGTKTLTLTASDFTNGVYILEFLFPENLGGGYCHYIDIYAPDGTYLGRR